MSSASYPLEKKKTAFRTNELTSYRFEKTVLTTSGLNIVIKSLVWSTFLYKVAALDLQGKKARRIKALRRLDES